MSGAGARPSAEYTWREILVGLADAGHAPLDESPELPSKDWSWPRFLLVLLAHGWFIRPKAFPLGRADDAISANPRKMNGRIAAFAALWVLALLVLPLSWVALAFGAWLIVLIPGLIEIYTQFQHEPNDTSTTI